MSLRGKNALVLGASGTLASGAVSQFLQEGATVVVVSRSDAKLKEIFGMFANKKENLRGVVGTYETKAQVEELYAKVKEALNGSSPDHVVSSLGFATLTPNGIISSDLKTLTDSFAESLFPTILAAQVILSDIRDKEGTTYTVTTGGFAHDCYWPGMWPATIKNSALSAVIKSLAKDTEANKVRVNGNCPHYSIAYPGAKINNFNLPVEQDSHEFGKTFLGFVLDPNLKGKLVDFDKKEDAEKFYVVSLNKPSTPETHLA